jgi:cytochrome P450
LLLWLKPRGLDALLDLASPRDVKEYYQFTETLAKSRIEEERNPDTEKNAIQREDMFHFLCTARDPDTGEFAISTNDLVSDARLLIMAGSDTSSTTVTGLFFYITRNPHVYAKLVKEVLETFQSVYDIGSRPELLAKCEYLRAVIWESMRMSPAGVCEAERIVQKGGAVIAGVKVPEGITVGVPPWCHNRNEDTFGDANTFRPERWIVSNDPETYNSQAEVNRLRRCFHPFTKGPGACLGQKMAMIQLCIIVARTLWRYDVRKAPGQTVGEGHPDLGWGRHDPSHYQLRDAYVSLREGPIVQFKRREHYSI